MTQKIKSEENTVSIIVTCHNEEKFIQECINSVLNQTAFEIIKEIIVVVDSTTDSSIEIIKNLSKKNDKIKIFEVKYKSLSKSRNFGIKKSTTNYIAFLDGDDYWSKEKLEIQFLQIKKLDKTYAFIYTNYIDFDDSKKYYKKIQVRSFNNSNNQLKEYFCKDGPIVPSTILIRSDVFNTIKNFDESLKYYEDTDFYLRVLEKYKIFFLNEYSCFKRRHPNQITNKLYDLIPYGDDVINISLLRNSNLNKLQNIRKSRNRVKAAIQSITILNEKKKAFYLIVDSIKFNFFNYLSWVSLISLILPKKINLLIINMIKSFIK